MARGFFVQVHSDHASFSSVSSLVLSSLNSSLAASNGLGVQPQLAAVCVKGCVQLVANIVSLPAPDGTAALAQHVHASKRLVEATQRALLDQLAADGTDISTISFTPALRILAAQGTHDSNDCVLEQAETTQPATATVNLLGCLPVCVAADTQSQVKLYVHVTAPQQNQDHPGAKAAAGAGTTAAAATSTSCLHPAHHVSAPVHYRVVAYTHSRSILVDIQGVWWPEGMAAGSRTVR